MGEKEILKEYVVNVLNNNNVEVQAINISKFNDEIVVALKYVPESKSEGFESESEVSYINSGDKEG